MLVTSAARLLVTERNSNAGRHAEMLSDGRRLLTKTQQTDRAGAPGGRAQTAQRIAMLRRRQGGNRWQTALVKRRRRRQQIGGGYVAGRAKGKG